MWVEGWGLTEFYHFGREYNVRVASCYDKVWDEGGKVWGWVCRSVGEMVGPGEAVPLSGEDNMRVASCYAKVWDEGVKVRGLDCVEQRKCASGVCTSPAPTADSPCPSV